MTDTVRERIIQAFSARAASLSTLPVERCKRSQAAQSARNVTIWDSDESDAGDAPYGADRLQFLIRLELQAPFGNANPSTAANVALGEIKHTLLADPPCLAGLAESLRYVQGTPTYPEDGSAFFQLSATFLIIYSTPKGDPYTPF